MQISHFFQLFAKKNVENAYFEQNIQQFWAFRG